MANNTDTSIFDGNTWGSNTEYLNYPGLQYLFTKNMTPSSASIDGSVGTDDLADWAVTSTKLHSEAVTTVKIASKAVTTAKLATSSVTEEKIANDAVTMDKIADGAVGFDQLSSVVQNQFKINVDVKDTLYGLNASPYGYFDNTYWRIDYSSEERCITLPIGKTLTITAAQGYSPGDIQGIAFVDYTDENNPQIVAEVPRQTSPTYLSYTNDGTSGGTSGMKISVACNANAHAFSAAVFDWRWTYSIDEERYVKNCVSDLMDRVEELEDAPIDNVPTADSSNLVYSGGVYNALQGIGGGEMTIVTEGSATTINAIIDNYYVLTYDVSNLTINLPNLTGETKVKGFVVFMKTGTYQSITINPAASGQNVYKYDGFSWSDDTTYELNFIWNGKGWIVSYGLVSGYANS